MSLTPKQKDTIREEFADIEHSRWSKWQAYLHSKLTKHTITSLNSRTGMWEDIKTGNYILHKEWVERWERQIATPYSELSEQEKDSDREQVEYYIKRMEEIYNEAYQQGYSKCWNEFKDMSPYEIGYKQGAKDKVEEVEKMVKKADDPYMLLATENRFLHALKNLQSLKDNT